ncbi:MAG TPA: acyl-CoA dehydrogenase family protein, partial [Novosphingobium sp.]|nr:acyl-CoA dehydrogenase family protein [Novosphingobium sp.]
MDFELNDEQQQLKSTVERYLASAGDFAARTRALRSESGWREAVWHGLAELGVLSIGLPEAHGGFGGGLEMMAAMEELGRALAPEPVAETLFQAAPLLARGGYGHLLEGIAAGSVRLALAVGEEGLRDDLSAIALRAARTADGWRLDGAKCVVVAAPWATHLLVAARTSGQSGDGEGLTLFVVPADAPGVSMTPYRMLDERRAADVHFAGVEVAASALVGAEGQGLALLEEWRDRAIAAAAAEACGVIERLLDDTVAYAK